VSDKTGYPARFVGLSPLLLPLPHLPGASAYVVGILLAVVDPHLQSHMYQINNTIQKYFLSSLIQKYKNKMKYIKTFTYGTVGSSWWKQHIRIPFEIDSSIGIVVQSYDLSPPLE
jgi:hypothetical protein